MENDVENADKIVYLKSRGWDEIRPNWWVRTSIYSDPSVGCNAIDYAVPLSLALAATKREDPRRRG